MRLFLIYIVMLFIVACSKHTANQNSICSVSQNVAWTEALEVLERCEVESVVQTHALSVTLFLKNNVIISTQEPTIDEIFRAIRRCGKNCSHIARISE